MNLHLRFLMVISMPPNYTDNGWHHYAVTFDAATKMRIIYRDGNIVATDM
jgi:hypothetical protein